MPEGPDQRSTGGTVALSSASNVDAPLNGSIRGGLTGPALSKWPPCFEVSFVNAARSKSSKGDAVTGADKLSVGARCGGLGSEPRGEAGPGSRGLSLQGVNCCNVAMQPPELGKCNKFHLFVEFGPVLDPWSSSLPPTSSGAVCRGSTYGIAWLGAVKDIEEAQQGSAVL